MVIKTTGGSVALGVGAFWSKVGAGQDAVKQRTASAVHTQKKLKQLDDKRAERANNANGRAGAQEQPQAPHEILAYAEAKLDEVEGKFSQDNVKTEELASGAKELIELGKLLNTLGDADAGVLEAKRKVIETFHSVGKLVERSLAEPIAKVADALNADKAAHEHGVVEPRESRNKIANELMSGLKELRELHKSLDGIEGLHAERPMIEKQAIPAIVKLAELELPALFNRDPNPYHDTLRDEVVRNLIGLWQRGMLSHDLIRVVAYDYPRLTDVSRLDTREPADMRDIAMRFGEVLERANNGDLPVEILARFPHLREPITEIYKNDAIEHGEPAWVGEARAERQFATAFVLENLPKGVRPPSQEAKTELLRHPEQLLHFFENHVEKGNAINVLLFQIASLQQDIEVFDHSRAQTDEGDKQVWRRAGELLNAAHELEVAQAQLAELEQLNSGKGIPAHLLENQQKLHGAAENARGDVVKAWRSLLEAGAIPIRGDDGTLQIRPLNIALNTAKGQIRDALSLFSTDIDDAQIDAIFETAQLDDNAPLLDRLVEVLPVDKISNTFLPSKSELVRKYIDPESIAEFGLPEPTADDFARIISKLHNQGLLSTHEAAQATRDLNQFRKNIQVRSPLNYLLSKATGRWYTFLNAFIHLHNYTQGREYGDGYYRYSGRRTIVQNRILANTVKTADQKSNRFSDLFCRWMAGDGHHHNHNLKADDRAVKAGWIDRLKAAVPEAKREGATQALEHIREAREALANATDNEIEVKASALKTAQQELRSALGDGAYNFIHLSIVALALSKRPTGLDLNYKRLNQFNAVEYADDTADAARELGMERLLGGDAADFRAFIDTEVATPPTVAISEFDDDAEHSDAQIEAMIETETFRASDLDQELKLLEKQIKKDPKGIRNDEPLYLDQLLSSVRSLPIQQKSTFILGRGGTSVSGLIGSLWATLGSIYAALHGVPAGVKYDGIAQDAQIIEIKRGIKEFQVRIRSGGTSAGAVGASAGAGLEGGVEAGQATSENEGWAFHFSGDHAVDDLQQFLNDFFNGDNAEVTLKEWAARTSEIERAKQRSGSSEFQASAGFNLGHDIGAVSVTFLAGDIGASWAETSLQSSYENRKHSEQKGKEFSEFGMERALRALNVGSVSRAGANSSAASATDVGGAANKIQMPSTGVSASSTFSTLRLTRRKEERGGERKTVVAGRPSSNGKLLGAGFYVVIDIRGKDPKSTLKEFLNGPLTEKQKEEVRPFLNAIADNDIEGELAKTILKTQENETIAIESELRAEALQIIQQWEELIDAYEARRANLDRANPEWEAIGGKVEALKGQVEEKLNDPASFKPKAYMTVPKCENITGSYISFYFAKAFKMGKATLREQSGYVLMPEDKKQAEQNVEGDDHSTTMSEIENGDHSTTMSEIENGDHSTTMSKIENGRRSTKSSELEKGDSAALNKKRSN